MILLHYFWCFLRTLRIISYQLLLLFIPYLYVRRSCTIDTGTLIVCEMPIKTTKYEEISFPIL